MSSRTDYFFKYQLRSLWPWFSDFGVSVSVLEPLSLGLEQMGLDNKSYFYRTTLWVSAAYLSSASVCVAAFWCFPGQLSHLPFVFGVSVTNLTEPARASATCTIAWRGLGDEQPKRPLLDDEYDGWQQLQQPPGNEHRRNVVESLIQPHPFWAVVNKSNAGQGSYYVGGTGHPLMNERCT